jgi:ketosteroid isomerase-like protein
MIDKDDLAAVNELVASYCWAVDEADGAGYAALWTEDGELVGATPQPLKGHAALAGMASGMTGTGMRHLYSNLICEYAGGGRDQIKAKFYNYVATYSGQPGLVAMAVCHADLVRQGGGWKIKTNNVSIKPASLPPG